MKEKLTNNLAMKIISVVFAFILWLVVVNINDPETTRSISAIPVKPLNEDVITNQNQVYSIEAGATVTIYVKGPRSVVDNLSASDFSATANFKEMSNVNAIPIMVTLKDSNYDNEIEISKKNNTMILKIESIETKQFNVETSLSGTLAEGYTLGDTTLSPDVIKVTGPQSVLDSIQKVVCDVDITGQSSDIQTKAYPRLLTNNDEVEIGGNVSVNTDSIDINIKMLSIKEVELDFETTGSPADGYQYTGLEYYPQKVMIAGLKTDLSKVNRITIPGDVINLDGATEDINTSIDIQHYLPTGIKLYDTSNSKITIVANIEGLITKSFKLGTSKIEMRNLPNGYQASFVSSSDITFRLTGLSSDINEFNVDTAEAYVDLSGMKEGSNEAQVHMSLSNNLSLEDSITTTIQLTKTAVVTTSDTSSTTTASKVAETTTTGSTETTGETQATQ